MKSQGCFGLLTDKGIREAAKAKEQVVAITKDGAMHVGRFDHDLRFIVQQNSRTGLSIQASSIKEFWIYSPPEAE